VTQPARIAVLSRLTIAIRMMAPYNCVSRASIWSEVWIERELSS
jgi:hypothetical protein